MPLKQLMRNKPLRRISLRIHKTNMMIHLANPLQLIGMAMMVWTPIHANQENSDMHPGETEQVEFKFVHVCCFAVEEEEEAEHGRLGTRLPAVDGVVRC